MKNTFLTGALGLLLIMGTATPIFAGTVELLPGADREQVVRYERSRVEQELRKNDEIIVRFKNESKFRRVKITAGENIDEVLSEMKKRDDVLYAEPNYIASAFFVPNDTYYRYQWNFDNAVNGGIEMEQAWDVTQGEGVTVAVIDTGVAYENFGAFSKAPDFAGTTFVQGYDFVANDTHPNDENGHGTHVAGTIAESTNDGYGVSGIAYKAKIMPVRVLDANGSGSYADVADGIRWAADNGANVVNLSLGGSSPASYIEEAVAYAYSRGVTIVAATGNNNSSFVSYPAAYDAYVIAVGAVRYDGARAPYSNYGPSIDFVAPGGDTSVDQNSDGYGDGILQQTFSSNPNVFGFYFFQGTSMATPHVAGVAALVISSGRASTPSEVRSILESSAKDLGTAGRDNTFGWGLIQADKAVTAPGVPAEDLPPSVTLESPAASSMVSGLIDIDATATDDHAISKIEFFIDNVKAATDATSPYRYSWDTSSVANGTHEIMVTAFDDANQSSSVSIEILVDNVSTVQTLFFDDFQSGTLSKWAKSGNWALQSPAEKSVPNSILGNKILRSAACAFGCSITAKPPLNTVGAGKLTLSFWRYVDNDLDSGEFLKVQVYNGGWITLKSWTHRNGDDDIWSFETFDLTPYANASLQIRFSARSSSNSEVVEVDDVKLIRE